MKEAKRIEGSVSITQIHSSKNLFGFCVEIILVSKYSSFNLALAKTVYLVLNFCYS